MYLKSLEMQGFKSFADKIKLDFGMGITAVVGPNGSGKSNISDAIRWVMGEQSAKSLRGGSMQDVIFSGTQKRKPLGFAEVTLVIDNADRGMDIDYEEVSLTRRVYRSGESEYFINKASCRLKDIHELFMDTGVGRDGYSVIGQGKISEIISSRAEERRYIFESAAGITKYRYRKEEAERKLSHTRENILRVSDIIAELELQLAPLKAASDKAKQYLNLRDELKNLDINVSLSVTERLRQALTETDKVHAEVSAHAARVRDKAGATETGIQQMLEEIRQNEEASEHKRTEQQEAQEILSGCKGDIQVLRSRIEHNQGSVARIEEELSARQEALYELEDAAAEKDDSLGELTRREEALSARLQEQSTRLEGLQKEQEEAGAQSEALAAELIEQKNRVAGLRLDMGNFSAISESFSQRSRAIAVELSQKEQELAPLARKKEQARTLEQEQKARQEDAAARLRQAREMLAAGETALTALARETAERRITLEKQLSRLRLLEEMERSFDHYSKSVRGVMKEFAEKDGILGTVAQLVKTPPRFAVAMETALGQAVQNIVTKTEEDAKAAIAWLKRSGQGRATFLPLTSARGGALAERGLDSEPGFLGVASDLVEYDPRLEKVVKGLLGRVAVAEDLDSAVAIARKYGYRFRIVTLEGELLTPGGAMSGGSRSNTAGLFSRASELEALKDSAAALEEALSRAQENEKKEASRLQALRERHGALSQEVQDAARALAQAEGEARHLQALWETVSQSRDALASEEKQIGERLVSVGTDLEEKRALAAALQEEISAIELQISRERERAQGINRLREEQAAALMGLRMELAGLQKDKEMQKERMENARARMREVSAAMEQKRRNIEELLETIGDLEEDIEFKTNQIEEYTQQTAALSRELARMSESRREAREKIKEAQERLGKEREDAFALQEELGRIEARREKADSEMTAIINRLWEEYELTLTAAGEYRRDIGELPAAQRKINGLREQMRSLGNINIDAIEEYQSISGRFEFLVSQRDDLETAGRNLQEVIADMIRVMKRQFEESFQTVNENFNQVFQELFGGGRARLVLSDPSDILTSGVEIDVQPPGKAVRGMIQLSGGEQAFVSIALLFAILKVRPSPFCILDEIEAALDEGNVYRFADFLKRFAKESQFIVVTHRRGTMEAADTLYGVTMQEQGVTSLLSLKMSEVPLDAATG